MPESSPYTSRMIDDAWQEARDANTAFDRYAGARKRLGLVREVAGLAIAGITIEDHALGALEGDVLQAWTEFDRHMNTKSPVMRAADSPFKVETPDAAAAPVPWATMTPEMRRVINRESPLCNGDELRAFAELRGYNKQAGAKAETVLLKLGRMVWVDDLANYAPVTDPQAEDFGMLRTLVHAADGRERYAFDKAAILLNVSNWVRIKPQTRGLGAITVSFLADYCNHAFPELADTLPVIHPPSLRQDMQAKQTAMVANLNELDPKELLLDEVVLRGEGRARLVTDGALRRHAASLGYMGPTAPHYSMLFQSIRHRLAPEVAHVPVGSMPHRVNEWLAYIGERDIGNVWGISPDAFPHIVDQLGALSTDSGNHIAAYTGRARELIEKYLHALKPVLSDSIRSAE